MGRTTTSSIIFTLLFATCIFSTSAQDGVSATFATTAQHEFESGLFERSIVNCERQLAMTNDRRVKAECNILKSKCFTQLGMYNDASRTLTGISVIGQHDSMVCELYYLQALNGFLQGLHEEASSHLFLLRNQLGKREMSYNASILSIVVYNEQALWDSALSVIKSSSYFTANQKDSLEMLYGKTPRIFKHKRVEWCSRIVPGSGQIMVGSVFEGLASFALCAGSLAFGAYEVIVGYYVTGYVMGAGLLNGFFFGGVRRLKLLVGQRNQMNIQAFNDKVKKIID